MWSLGVVVAVLGFDLVAAVSWRFCVRAVAIVAVSTSVTIDVTASVAVTKFECLDHCCEFVKSESRDQKAETVKM